MGLEVLLGAASAHGYNCVDSDCGDGSVVCESKATGLDPSLSPLDSLLLYSTPHRVHCLWISCFTCFYLHTLL